MVKLRDCRYLLRFIRTTMFREFLIGFILCAILAFGADWTLYDYLHGNKSKSFTGETTTSSTIYLHGEPATLVTTYAGNPVDYFDLVGLYIGAPVITVGLLVAPVLTLKDFKKFRPECRFVDVLLKRPNTLAHVEEMSFQFVNDTILHHLAKLVNLRSLELNGPTVTDARVRRLRALTRLRSLTLQECPVTDAGLDHLSAASQTFKYYY